MARRPVAAQSAFGPMVFVAIEQFTPSAQRLVQDALAVRFLPLRSRLLAAACRPGAARELVRRTSDQYAPGICGSVLCRKRYADDQVSAALAADIRQV